MPSLAQYLPLLPVCLKIALNETRHQLWSVQQSIWSGSLTWPVAMQSYQKKEIVYLRVQKSSPHRITLGHQYGLLWHHMKHSIGWRKVFDTATIFVVIVELFCAFQKLVGLNTLSINYKLVLPGVSHCFLRASPL